MKIRQIIIIALFISGLLACQNNGQNQQKITGKWYIEDIQAADTSDVMGSALLAFSIARNNIEAMEFTKDNKYNIYSREDSALQQNKYKFTKDQSRIIIDGDTIWEITKLTSDRLVLLSQDNTKVFLSKH
ncbi:MAG: hypothetical protein ACOCPM_02435 [Bacteroidales bacterium]